MKDYEEIPHKGGIVIRICPDYDAESPREWDNAGVMVCWHKRYQLGDKHEFQTPDDFKEWKAENESTPGLFTILPVYLLDHSGLYLRTSDFSDVDPCRWDSGQVGWIYMPPETAEADFHNDREKVLACLQAEVRTYNEYLEGNVFRYEIHQGHNVVDSCGGFYGYDACVEEAKEAADHALAEGPDIENVVNHVENIMGFLDDLKELMGAHKDAPLDRVHEWVARAKEQATRVRDSLLAQEDGEVPEVECPKSPTGKHEPSINHTDFLVADGGVNEGDEGVIVDVVCRHCATGRGSVRAFFEDIQWDLDPDGGEDD